MSGRELKDRMEVKRINEGVEVKRINEDVKRGSKKTALAVEWENGEPGK
jgi:hypothetical protein